MKTLFKDLALLLGLTVLSAGIGLAANGLRKTPVSLTYRTPAQRLASTQAPKSAESPAPTVPADTVIPKPSISREIEIVTLDRFQSLKEADQLLVLDVRPDLFYKIGHIPGAHSLQAKEFETDHEKMKSLLETTIAQGKKIAVYCSGSHCPDASKVAKNLSELGYGNLLVFEAGWEGWQLAGLKEEQEAL